MTYPELYQESLRTDADVQPLLVDIISGIVCGHDIYNLALAHAKSLLAEIASIRQEKNLPPLDNEPEAVANMVFGAYLGSFEAPNIQVATVVENMPDLELDPKKSFEELVQQCYDTTKTPSFKEAVKNSEEHPTAVLYAIEMWRKEKGSDKIQDALKNYSRMLYNKSMSNVSVNIRF